MYRMVLLSNFIVKKDIIIYNILFAYYYYQ